MNDLVELVETNEPRLIAYNVYLSEDETRMTVVHIHYDSASLEFHMKVAGPAFPKFKEFVKLLTIDVYGNLSGQLMEQLRKKARMLGNATVMAHSLETGFTRFCDLPPLRSVRVVLMLFRPMELPPDPIFKKIALTSERGLHSEGHKNVGAYPPLVHTALGDCIVECIVDNKEQTIL